MGGNAVGIHFLLPMLNLSFPLARYLRGSPAMGEAKELGMRV